MKSFHWFTNERRFGKKSNFPLAYVPVSIVVHDAQDLWEDDVGRLSLLPRLAPAVDAVKVRISGIAFPACREVTGLHEV